MMNENNPKVKKIIKEINAYNPKNNLVNDFEMQWASHNKSFGDTFFPFVKSHLGLQADHEVLGDYVFGIFNYEREMFGDPGSIYRNRAKEAFKKIGDLEKEIVTILLDISEICLDSSNMRQKIENKPNPLINITLYKGDKGFAFLLDGVGPYISELKKVEEKYRPKESSILSADSLILSYVKDKK